MKNDSSSTNNVLAVLAVTIVAVALVNLGITYVKISDFNNQLTGLATGYVNVTVVTVTKINVTHDIIFWGGGSITGGKSHANLTTVRMGANVVNGNWSTASSATNPASGLVVENQGNINISISFQATNNASDLFGNGTNIPSGFIPRYQWNVTNNETASCSGGAGLNTWINVNKSDVKFCHQFSPLTESNEIYLDVKLVIPYDTPNTGYALIDPITITAAAAIV